jgi:hypothetical protein
MFGFGKRAASREERRAMPKQIPNEEREWDSEEERRTVEWLSRYGRAIADNMFRAACEYTKRAEQELRRRPEAPAEAGSD